MSVVSRRLFLQASSQATALVLLAACQPASAPQPTPTNPLIKPRAAAGAPLTAVQASSEAAVGRNRFAIGLIDAQNQPVTSGTVSIDFFKVDPASGTAQKKFDAPATFRAVQMLDRGIWVSRADFDAPGPWGIQVTHTPSGQQPRQARLSFQVQSAFSAPGYDAPAPRSASLTLSDVGGDAARVCSNSPTCSMHEVSIKDALAPGQKPLVVLFATPAFCTSNTCAPELTAIEELRGRGYGERASFVHVEIYDYPFAQMNPSPVVREWKLPSEPWVFLVDRGGTVRERFEGAAPVEELEPALTALL